MEQYEYCVMRKDYPQEPHRVPPLGTPALQWCQAWVRQWYEEMPKSHPNLFYVARRPVGGWEKVDDQV